MKQIVLISGKGGTGKTVLCGSLVTLASKGDDVVIADCDVDAPDLHLILAPEIKERHLFNGLPKARIDKKKCTACGKCLEVCRFGAVTEDFEIDGLSCDGCRFCLYICPAQAITMEENISGEYFVSNTNYGPMIHAQLGVAEENSGKLVAIVRNRARQIAEQSKHQMIIIDGPPGIGCPTISSISGVDLAIIVTEPTVTAIHDLKRALSLTEHFGIMAAVIVNKFDLDEKNTGLIEEFCQEKGIKVLGRVPFDPAFPGSIVAKKPLVDYSRELPARILSDIFSRLKEIL